MVENRQDPGPRTILMEEENTEVGSPISPVTITITNPIRREDLNLEFEKKVNSLVNRRNETNL